MKLVEFFGVVAAFAFVGAGLAMCAGRGAVVTKPENAIAAAKAYGIEQPKIKATHYLSPSLMGGCKDNSDAAYDVTGTRNGEAVEVVVCCGWPRPPCYVRGAVAP